MLSTHLEMCGFVKECDFQEAEAAFPGIERFYRSLKSKPLTFLDLVRLYLDASQPQQAVEAAPAA
jgi:hypothetical protein